MAKNLKIYLIGLLFFLFLGTRVFAMGGSVPAGLPGVFGFGAMDNFATPWKSGQGTTCWDYSYTYLTQGWRSWNGDDPSYPIEHARVFEPMGQIQVVTFYYSNNNPSQYTGTAFMTTYFNDLKLLFQKINQYSTNKIIVHIDPDLIGFWTSSNYTATTAGVVAVGSTGIAEIASVENNIRGWNRAIRILRDTYAPNKALLATHISGWCYGFDILNSSITQAEVATRVQTITNFITSIENGYPTDLFFVDPADRDADWRRLTNGDGNLYWTDPTHSYMNARSFGKMGAMVDYISTNLARRGMMWQIPTGNTYFKTCNNTTGHYRDNYAQMFIPSLSANGSSGTPGDAYSNTVTAAGPGYWAQRGIIGILFGPGDTTCTHLFDNRADGTTNPATDSGPGGPSYDVWGQANSSNTDDDGGYIRRAVAQYCSRGKFSFFTPTNTITGTPPSPTRTPTYTPTAVICSTMNYDGDTASTNLASGAVYISANSAITQSATAAYAGTNGMMIQCAWTGYWGGGGWNWANWAAGDVFNASTYTGIEFWIRTATGTSNNLSVNLVDSTTAGSTAVNVGTITTAWQKITIPFTSLTGVNLALLWELSFSFGGAETGNVTVYFDSFSFTRNCSTPTSTITGTPPTRTRTPTITPTYAVCNSINYDGETGFTDITSGGAWAAPASSTAKEVTSIFHAGTKSLEYNFIWASGGWGGGGWNWASYVSAQASDLTQAVNLEFWARSLSATANTFAVNLIDNTAAASAAVNLPALTTAWQRITIPMSSFTGINLSAVWELTLNAGGTASGNVYVYLDDIVFVTQDCRTATPTCTRTRTSTATQAYTNTYTRTATASSTRTATTTFTQTLTVPPNTFTRTPTMTPTGTYTGTATRTFTPANTATFTSTPTGTRTSTAGATNTYTRTVTATFTRTYTATPVNTFTVTSVITATFTSTRTYTGTAMPGVTYTMTRTLTMTASPVNSATATPSRTGTSTTLPSATFTGTRTASAAATFTGTGTPTATRTGTPTYTRTFTITQTHTFSPTITQTWTGTPPTATHTPTITLTATRTPSFTATSTASRTATGTFTQMPSATNTAQATATYSRTSTPGATLSFTATITPSGTYSRTATITQSATQIIVSATFTPSFTASPVSTATQTASRTSTVTQSATQIIISATITPTFTFTRTRTITPSATVTSTVFVPSATATYTRTTTQTPVSTAVPTGTYAATVTVTLTGTPSYTGTVTPLPTGSPTRTASLTPVSTPTNTPLITTDTELTDVVVYPNPHSNNGPLNIGFSVTRPATKVCFRVYTSSFRKIKEITIAAASGAFNNRMSVAIPAHVLGSISAGSYYYILSVTDDRGKVTRSAPSFLIILK